MKTSAPPILAVAAALAVLATPVSAATFIVNSASDQRPKALVIDGVCSAAWTLREAFLESNFVSGPDLINFAIGSGPHVILLNKPLPPIQETVTIDGYSQRGASENTLQVGNNAEIRIRIESPSGMYQAGITFTNDADGSLVRRLSIVGFRDRALELFFLKGVNIEGNFIGITPKGEAFGNGLGIYASDQDDFSIGGSSPAERNVISGNGAGIELVGSRRVFMETI